MAAIKNIIFDLGGVIIPLAFERTREAFINLGVKDFDAIYSKSQQTNLFDEFDKGKIQPADFRNQIRKHIDGVVSDVEIDAAWDAMLLDIPKEKLNLLLGLQKKYRTFLLSNTNVIHVRNFSAELQRVHGTPDFSPYFEKCYYSCNIGMRKPDAEIFEFVLRENNLKAEETFFIDDSAQHINGAAACRINTGFLDSGMKLEDLLRQSGVPV